MEVPMKKILSVVLSLVIATAAFSLPVFAADFSDVKADKYYYDSVMQCADKGFVRGYEDGTFRPNGNITRAEFAVIMNKVLELQDAANNTFRDVKAGKWYTAPVLNCVKAGVISGYGNGYFGINDPVTREQAAVILAKAFSIEGSTGKTPFSDDGNISPWAKSSVKGMYDSGYIAGMKSDSGARYFAPRTNLTRGQICVLLTGCMRSTELEEIPDAYKPIILQCASFVLGYDVDEELFTGGQDEYYAASEYFHRVRSFDNPLESVGFCLYDIDSDGTKELLISGGTNNNGLIQSNLPWLIYTIQDGKAKHVAGSWTRSAHHLGYDGYLYYRGSGGAGYTYARKEVLKNGQLVALATAFSNNGYQGDHYCYTEGEEPVTDLPSSFLRSEEQMLGVLLRRTTDLPCSSHHFTHSSKRPPRWSSPRARISKSIFSRASTPTV